MNMKVLDCASLCKVLTLLKFYLMVKILPNAMDLKFVNPFIQCKHLAEFLGLSKH